MGFAEVNPAYDSRNPKPILIRLDTNFCFPNIRRALDKRSARMIRMRFVNLKLLLLGATLCPPQRRS